jgi:carbonic anhydrase/acetyltransferase-like protein (isoleucine patch superfamily)
MSNGARTTLGPKEPTLDWQAADYARRYPGALVLPYQGRWPRIDPSAWIAPGASVVGDVEIGRDSSVWYGSVLRGDVHAIRVGARTNLQDGSVLHVTQGRFPCQVGDEVTIGHRAVVHGCRVGDGALVGIGAVVLDGAELGAEAWLAAGALLAPGASIPARQLGVGTPAKALRALRAEELADQRERTLEYVRTAARHRASR